MEFAIAHRTTKSFFRSDVVMVEWDDWSQVSTIIQEHGLSFRHAGREGSASESILEEVEHDRIMGHNFATYI